MDMTNACRWTRQKKRDVSVRRYGDLTGMISGTRYWYVIRRVSFHSTDGRQDDRESRSRGDANWLFCYMLLLFLAAGCIDGRDERWEFSMMLRSLLSQSMGSLHCREKIAPWPSSLDSVLLRSEPSQDVLCVLPESPLRD